MILLKLMRLALVNQLPVLRYSTIRRKYTTTVHNRPEGHLWMMENGSHPLTVTTWRYLASSLYQGRMSFDDGVLHIKSCIFLTSVDTYIFCKATKTVQPPDHPFPIILGLPQPQFA